MSQVSPNIDSKALPSDRRVFLRQPVRSLAYVELGEGNGGIVLNVSEGGLAVQAVMSLMNDELPCMRLQLAHSTKQIETKGRITWTSEFRKLAGVEFVDLSPEALRQIREWIAFETPAAGGSEKTAPPKNEPAASRAAPPEGKILVLDPEPAMASANPIENLEEVGTHTVMPSPPPLSQPAMAPASLASSPTLDLRSDSPPADDAKASSDLEANIPTPSSPPADRYGFKPSALPSSIASTNTSSTRGSRKTAAMVALFAGLSLGVGWLAGKAGLQRIVSEEAFKEHVPVETEPPVPHLDISEFEVVDLKNQRWMIRFDASPGVQGHNGSLDTTPGTTQAASTSSAPPQIPSLSTSIVSRKSSDDIEPGSQVPSPPADSENSSVPSMVSEPHSSIAVSPLPSEPASPPAGGALQAGELTRRIEPTYPAEALAERVEGTVKLDAIIDQDGNVKTVRVLGGPKTLFQAASDAVRQWRYSPTLLNGNPIQTERQISIKFQLSPVEPK